jgi:nucleoside diphosphate kinase
VLKGGAKKSEKNYKKDDQLLEMKQEPLLSFMLKQKKGSKKIRKILEKEETEQAQPGSLRIVESFARITATLVPNDEVLEKILSVWNMFCFSNDF